MFNLLGFVQIDCIQQEPGAFCLEVGSNAVEEENGSGAMGLLYRQTSLQKAQEILGLFRAQSAITTGVRSCKARPSRVT
jgi:hypothetical protein